MNHSPALPASLTSIPQGPRGPGPPSLSIWRVWLRRGWGWGAAGTPIQPETPVARL